MHIKGAFDEVSYEIEEILLLEAGGKLIRFGLNVLLDECRI
jgi:hypothetical protein